MAVMVRLTSEGQVQVEEVVDALAEAGLGPVAFQHVAARDPRLHDTLHACLRFRDPANRRRTRELTMMQGAVYRGEEDQAHIRGESYTSFTMAAWGGGPAVMELLAGRFGGRYTNDADPAGDRLIEPSPAALLPRIA